MTIVTLTRKIEGLLAAIKERPQDKAELVKELDAARAALEAEGVTLPDHLVEQVEQTGGDDLFDNMPV